MNKIENYFDKIHSPNMMYKKRFEGRFKLFLGLKD